MTGRDLGGRTAIVTGASRGFGRATAVELAHRGAHVVGVARSTESLHRLTAELDGRFTPIPADVSDPELATRLIADHQPQLLILNAGATPTPGSLIAQNWTNFSANWHVDVHHVFHFAQAALTSPLPPGSVVASMSSGAALRGSPLSGGYAGAKATIRMISSYAAADAARNGLGIRFVALLPQLTPATDLGRIYTRAYAEHAGADVEDLVAGMGGALGADAAASFVADIVSDDSYGEPAYLIAAGGVRPVD